MRRPVFVICGHTNSQRECANYVRIISAQDIARFTALAWLCRMMDEMLFYKGFNSSGLTHYITRYISYTEIIRPGLQLVLCSMKDDVGEMKHRKWRCKKNKVESLKSCPSKFTFPLYEV